MTKSILAVTLALGLSAGLAGATRADDQSARMAGAAPADQLSLLQPMVMPDTTVGASINAYQNNINPNVVVPITGIYDQSDRWLGPGGFPLPGDPWNAEMGGGGG